MHDPRVRQPPVVAAIEMGYGHLRAALPLADLLGVPITEVDRPPVARIDERRLWQTARSLYEGASRGSRLPIVGPLFRRILDGVTAIEPLHPYRDQSAPTRQVRTLDGLVRGGLGRGLAEHVDRSGTTLLTTYFSAALSVAHHGDAPIDCVVTDADISRAWAPPDPASSRIRYLVPSRRALRRLRAYGVPAERIRFTGFPLPDELVGGPDMGALRQSLAARLVRLDRDGSFIGSRRREVEFLLGPLPIHLRGEPPTITFAVGGAGAQAELAGVFLPGLAPLVRDHRLRIALVAGTRSDVAATLSRALERAGLADCPDAELLHDADFRSYYHRFNALLARTDVLWTKPSELVFYGALGLPLLLSQSVGVHETYNRRWARERGAGLKQRDARHAHHWLTEWLDDGVLAAAAWAGHALMPSAGAYRIAELAMGVEEATSLSATSFATRHSRPA